ncbi:MAG: hypothetical protein KKA07_16940 [Bacteroidetes bacterium]|nr:hypothetical protein [Bacteroidota bacterium]
MQDLKEYLQETLSVKIKVKSLPPKALKSLPIFMANLYRFELISLYDKEFLLVFAEGDFTTGQLKTHLDTISNALKITPVAVVGNMEAYKRKRLIEKRIPFIITAKQMYLPDLLIDLKEFGNNPVEQQETMQPAAQLLLLHHLQIESLENLNFAGIADKLGYNSNMTITRAAYYLHKMGLCEIRGTRDKSLHFGMNKKEIWEKVEPLMTSPVKKIQYFSGYVSDGNAYKSNNNALAHYSDLNDDVLEYYAVRPGYFKFLPGANLKPAPKNEGNICIEEWKYNPYFATKTKYVDPLSLYLCFRNDENERVEMALEQLIENIKW